MLLQRDPKEIAEQARRDFETSHQYFLKKLGAMNAAAEHKAEMQAALVQGILAGSGVVLLAFALTWLLWKKLSTKFKVVRVDR